MVKSKEEIVTELQTVARQVFARPDLTIARETVADDVAEWDSLSHMQLIMQVEKRFGIRLTIVDISGLENVGDLVDAVESKLT